MSDLHYLLAILLMGAITFFLRALPFMAHRLIRHQPRFRVLAVRLPVAMMVLLTLYAMGVHHWQQWQDARAQILAVLFVVALQLWRRQALLSILGGTAFYALLINLIWPT